MDPAIAYEPQGAGLRGIVADLHSYLLAFDLRPDAGRDQSERRGRGAAPVAQQRTSGGQVRDLHLFLG